MSHVTTVDFEIKDEDEFKKTCRELGYEVTENAEVKLYQGDALYKDVIAVRIPDWNYPLAVKDGKIYYDNYGGNWGDTKQLSVLKQQYTKNLMMKTAKRKGYRVEERKVDGKIKLRLTR